MDEAALLARLAERPDDADAARRLATIYEVDGRYEALAAFLIDRLEHEREAGARADLYEQAAWLFEERLGSPENALLILQEGFAETADDRRFGQAMARLAARAAEWDAVLRAYEAAVSGATSPQIALPLHRRLAEWYVAQDRDGDAAPHWRCVLSLDPRDGETARALEAHCEDAGDWRSVVELLRMRAGLEPDAEARLRLYKRAAHLLESRLDDAAGAMDVVGEAWAQTGDPGLGDALERLAESSGQWAKLAAMLEDAIRAGRLAPAAADRQLARIFGERLDDPGRAAAYHARILEAEPGHLPSLVAVHTDLNDREDWPALAELLATHGPHVDDREAQFQLYRTLGDLHLDRLDDPKAAVAAWMTALEIQPDDKLVLLRLLDAYDRGGRWEARIKVLRRLAKLEPEEAKRAQLYYAMAVIQRDQLEDRYVAVRTLDKALDLDPTLLRAFGAIDEILTADRDYERQDRYYRKMLVRAREHRLGDALVVGLARNLGEINRSRLGNYPEALKAYQIVRQRRPDDAEIVAIVAELHALCGQLEEAIKLQHWRVRHTPTEADPYHHLATLYQRRGQADPAWCVCQVLDLFGEASVDERVLYKTGRKQQGGRASRPLDARDWQLLTTARKRGPLDALFGLLHPHIAPLMALDPKALGLDARADRWAPGRSKNFERVLTYVSQLIGAPPPALWSARWASGLCTANLEPAGILVGADIDDRKPADELAFLCARQVYLLAGQHFLATVDEREDARQHRLVTVVDTARALFVPGGAHVDGRLLKALEKLPPAVLAPLRDALTTAAGAASPEGIAGWLGAVEDTANRLGFLLCADLKTAVRMVQESPRALGGGDGRERVRALVRFAVSEPYFELRRRLGYSIAG